MSEIYSACKSQPSKSEHSMEDYTQTQYNQFLPLRLSETVHENTTFTIIK